MKATKYFNDPNTAALAESAARGDLAGVERAAAAGGDVNAIGETGITPLLYVLSESRNKEGLSALLKKKADPNYISPNGFCPMLLAAVAPDTSFLRLFLEHGGNPNLTDPDGLPAAYIAAREARWPNLELLLDHGASVNTKDSMDYSILMVVAGLGHYEMAAKLIERGADVRAVARSSSTVAKIISRTQPASSDPQAQWRRTVIQMLAARGVQVPPPPN